MWHNSVSTRSFNLEIVLHILRGLYFHTFVNLYEIFYLLSPALCPPNSCWIILCTGTCAIWRRNNIYRREWIWYDYSNARFKKGYWWHIIGHCRNWCVCQPFCAAQWFQVTQNTLYFFNICIVTVIIVSRIISLFTTFIIIYLLLLWWFIFPW